MLTAFHSVLCVATDGNQNFYSFAVPAKSNCEASFLSELNVLLTSSSARVTESTAGGL